MTTEALAPSGLGVFITYVFKSTSYSGETSIFAVEYTVHDVEKLISNYAD